MHAASMRAVKLDVSQLRKVSAETDLDPRTITGYLSGSKRTVPLLARAIDDALVRLGYVKGDRRTA